ncbi:GNAT family N-acetyltransferase [Priestia flexa]|uniref:GNAT family N-acetyltransferase n=1 Tax=Priestia flexa TaxID=86664 RepID=UPI001F4CB9D6|nr:GNAT family N-acetyltransferase [Priestia flexa]
MKLCLKPLSMEDEEALYQFEVINRTYFEQYVPSRGKDYYSQSGFHERLRALMLEQEQLCSLFYLIKNEHQAIIGRINVVDINDRAGELGYRIGEEYVDQKIATQAVRILLDKLVAHKQIKSLQAKTTTTNVASQKVLEQNGFLVQKEVENNSGTNSSLSFIHYKWSQ